MSNAAAPVFRSPLHGCAPLQGRLEGPGGRPVVALRDLSLCDRIGFKGIGSTPWLAAHACDLPQRPNLLTRAVDGLTVGRLAGSEYVLLSDRADEHLLLNRLRASYGTDRPADCYLVPKADGQAMLELTGACAFDVLAKASPIDFRPLAFPAGSIAQTTCARVTVQILHVGVEPHPAVLLLVDTSYALHLWDSLADAMREFGGPGKHAGTVVQPTERR